MIFTKFPGPGWEMAHQNHQYPYRNIDDSSIWAAKSIYLVDSTICIESEWNLWKLDEITERGGISPFSCFHTISGGSDLQIPM